MIRGYCLVQKYTSYIRVVDQTFSFCVQKLSTGKYFELEEERLLDFMKRDEAWAKQRREAEELAKKAVSCGF